ncbi:MAG TPA: fumarylacetoacetase [Gemmatimonadaceae bacterium]|nr:fumarylacetoacetase [Gemmatimonadaceae bacterium]
MIERTRIDETHDPGLESWVAAANAADGDFPVQNLPFGTFRREFEERPRVGIAIGDQVLDCVEAARAGCFDSLDPSVRDALQGWSMNGLMALGRADARAVRRVASRMLRADGDLAGATRALADRVLVPMTDVSLLVPAEVGDYTDFYASVFHATRVGALFRPDNPLLPNYKWIPIGYQGRASSIGARGAPVHRPSGPTRAAGATDAPPVVGPSRSLDYEVELALWVCGENALGETVPIARAADRLFGVGLLNDWSARDLQSWEYQPLGPFLSKSFVTTVSPWIVTPDALEPCRAAASGRAAGDPAPLPYLDDAGDRAHGAFGIVVEALLSSARMRAEGIAPHRLSVSDARTLYWTPAQMIAHHASNGCNLRPGDLLGTGTVSGPTDDSRACLLEITRRGAEPVSLPGGETRTFLQDGDEVILRGWCERAGARRIGFGECRGTVRGASHMNGAGAPLEDGR